MWPGLSCSRDTGLCGSSHLCVPDSVAAGTELHSNAISFVDVIAGYHLFLTALALVSLADSVRGNTHLSSWIVGLLTSLNPRLQLSR
jgi:hypothetical protein